MRKYWNSSRQEVNAWVQTSLWNRFISKSWFQLKNKVLFWTEEACRMRERQPPQPDQLDKITANYCLNLCRGNRTSFTRIRYFLKIFYDIFLCSCCFLHFLNSLHLADGNNFGNPNWPKTKTKKQFGLIKCQPMRGKRGCFHVNIWFNYIQHVLHIYIKYLAYIRSFIKPLFLLGAQSV